MEKQVKNSLDQNIMFDHIIQHAIDSARIERKICLHPYQIKFFKRILLNCGFRQPYKDREVNSIYYDDIKRSCAIENLDGIKRRLKFRVRYYGSYNGYLNREIKIKNGFIGYKITQLLDLNKKDLSYKVLREISSYFSFFSKKILIPLSKISYTRSYFENMDGIRCTLDRNIRSVKLLNNNYYDEKFNNYEVIEFKFNPDFDTYFRQNIWPNFSEFNIRMTKSSKYIKSLT